jgi:hypothetical protein
MGYRSDVAYVIRFETAEQRDTFVELVRHRNDADLTQALIECETEYEEPIITFEVDDVKWYADYKDVKAHYTLMEWAVELFPEKAGFLILMLGEDGKEESEEGGETDGLGEYIYTSHSVNTEFPAIKSTTQE